MTTPIEALTYISNARWNENADLDDICTMADRALASLESDAVEKVARIPHAEVDQIVADLMRANYSDKPRLALAIGRAIVAANERGLSTIATDEAATALTEARAEIERLRNLLGDPEGTIAHADAITARAEKAESALAEAVEVIDHLSSFSISDELGRTGKVADLCKAWVEHKKAARRFIASQEPAEQEK